jgi:hypothetical protein
MKEARLVILIASIVGMFAMFLPFFSVDHLSVTYWDFRTGDEAGVGWLNGPCQVYFALAGFATPLLLVLLGPARRPLGALAAAVGFALAFACDGVHHGMSIEGVSTAMGGKLLFVSALVGGAASLVAFVKPALAKPARA